MRLDEELIVEDAVVELLKGVKPSIVSALVRSDETHGKANTVVLSGLVVCGVVIAAFAVFVLGFSLGICARLAVDYLRQRRRPLEEKA